MCSYVPCNILHDLQTVQW